MDNYKHANVYPTVALFINASCVKVFNDKAMKLFGIKSQDAKNNHELSFVYLSLSLFCVQVFKVRETKWLFSSHRFLIMSIYA